MVPHKENPLDSPIIFKKVKFPETKTFEKGCLNITWIVIKIIPFSSINNDF
jgi:hypothetical protein